MPPQGAGGEPEPAAVGPPPLQQEDAHERPDECPPGEAVGGGLLPAEPPGQAAQDDPQVVDQGAEGGDHEALPGELHRGEQLAEDEEELGGQDDACAHEHLSRLE